METVITNAPVSLTTGCINELKRLQAGSDELKPYLRVGVKGGGCSGMTYVLGWDDKTDKDDEFNIEGIAVIMERSHGIYLLGMQVDFEDGLNARGFVFNNPNASKTCGCGTSFAV
jgi:iron-sulfur cluster assembly protein